MASAISVYNHGYVIAVKGILGQKKKNESWISQLVRANGDLIDSVLATLVENEVVPGPEILYFLKWFSC